MFNTFTVLFKDQYSSSILSLL